ncbi:BLUF domain-containing protein [Halopseudomonas salegens]|uniref:Sensors of blue-light using FAD n=1 Tax=Halopseudomonas salegens TaxID=1434072 RepID=A0A1H2GAU9_9GAMM|nr:BLUF domain-containing protein [Halopseudomonas salegens]SDU16602.1 Sensors of blue-light using FAD [Halopseudomonas salegens]
MTELVRIIYISRATFDTLPAADGVEPTVSRILSVSRRNNRNNGLVGMLYYGDSCFFQCLEGERNKVEALYRTLLKDKRHTDLKILASEPIKRLSFPDWNMKYVPLDQSMSRLMSEHGFERFDPYRFDHHLVERVMQLMQGVPDPTEPTTEPRPSAPCRSIQLDTAEQAPPASEGSRTPLLLPAIAITISSLALLISLSCLGMQLGWL